VTIVRKAKTSDKGWDQSPTVGEQVVVTLPDGTEKTVPKNQITPAS
jgi:phage baseplate assembly protein gpV